MRPAKPFADFLLSMHSAYINVRESLGLGPNDGGSKRVYFCSYSRVCRMPCRVRHTQTHTRSVWMNRFALISCSVEHCRLPARIRTYHFAIWLQWIKFCVARQISFIYTYFMCRTVWFGRSVCDKCVRTKNFVCKWITQCFRIPIFIITLWNFNCEIPFVWHHERNCFYFTLRLLTFNS